LGDPGVERDDELGSEAAPVDLLQPAVRGLARVEPLVEEQEIVDPELPGARGGLQGQGAGGRGPGVGLRPLAGPPRRLVAASRGRERREREVDDRGGLDAPLEGWRWCGAPFGFSVSSCGACTWT